jgi:hypothetical protein
METTIILADDEVLVKKKVKRSTQPNYYMVGNGTVNKYKIESIDLIKEITKMTKAEQFLILAIKDGITYATDYNPVVKVSGSTKHQKNQIIDGYRKLSEKNLVRRIKNGWYMINPNALIPTDYPSALKIWKDAEERNTRKSKEVVTDEH